jgi:hypothetical protein
MFRGSPVSEMAWRLSKKASTLVKTASASSKFQATLSDTRVAGCKSHQRRPKFSNGRRLFGQASIQHPHARRGLAKKKLHRCGFEWWSGD